MIAAPRKPTRRRARAGPCVVICGGNSDRRQIESRMLLLDERGLVSSPNVRVSATLDTVRGNPACTSHPLRQNAANVPSVPSVVLRARAFRQADLLARLRGMEAGRIVTVTHFAKDQDGAW